MRCPRRCAAALLTFAAVGCASGAGDGAPREDATATPPWAAPGVVFTRSDAECDAHASRDCGTPADASASGDDEPRGALGQAIDSMYDLLPENAVVIPYVLQSDLFGTGAGLAFAFPDWPHEQATTAGFAIASSNGSLALALVGADWSGLVHERVLLDPLISIGTYGDQRIYTGTRRGHRGERAGQHDSDENNYIEGDGEDLNVRLRFGYVLPIGAGRTQIRPDPELEDGLLVGRPNRTGAWNPLESGRTVIQFEPFYRNQSAESDDDDREVELRSNGIKLGLFHDNTDYPINPSTGSRQRIAVARDFDWFDSTGAWTSMEAQLSQFFDLGATDVLAQQVLAFDVWGSHAFTWRTKDTPRGPRIVRAPPNFEGARLGGLFRLRAYDASRFSDQSALHYTAEYRVIPRVNPLDSIPLLREIGADWTQFVVFAEAGRVNDGFDLGDLHSDMKTDVGVGVRLYVHGVVIRVDAAVGDEGAGLQVMVAQPF